VGVWSGAGQEFLYKRLRKAGIELRAHTWIDAVRGDAVDAYDVFSGVPVELGRFDTVVLATGSAVDDTVYRQLGQDQRVIRVGDCLAPRRLDNAMWDGLHAADRLSAVGTTLKLITS
jgi:hypothetical protein